MDIPKILKTLLFIALVALWVTPQAEAGEKMDYMRTLANKVWHSPCQGNWAFWISPRLKDDVAGQASGCTITVRPLSELGWQQWCMTILHEVGHVAGRPHSRNPRSVMYYRARWGVVRPDCRSWTNGKEFEI